MSITPRRNLHFNGVSWNPCHAQTRVCKYLDLTETEKQKPSAPTFKETNLRVLRAYSHEYFIALNIVENSPKAMFGTSENQIRLLEKHKGTVTLLTLSEGTDYVEQIKQLAETSIKALPAAVGEVHFVDKSANGGEVYDVIYHDKNQNRVAVSCKLAEVEDKSYRFNTRNYIFTNIQAFNKTIFLGKTHMTYEEALTEANFTIRQYQTRVISLLKEVVTQSQHKDRSVLEKLIRERFIGVGDYYKTLNDGTVRYYPELRPTDTVVIDENNVHTTETSIIFPVTVKSSTNSTERKYSIHFRVKFKDGITKPVQFSDGENIKSLGATIKLVIL